MIFWKGIGQLAVFIALIALFLVQIITYVITQDPSYFSNNSWLYLVVGAIGGTSIWLMGKHLHSRPEKKKIDPKTQKEIMVKPQHSLFGIKFEYWAFIVAVSAIIFALP